MKRYYRTVIALAVLVIVGAGLWLYKRYGEIKADAYETRKAEIAAHIQERTSVLIKPEDFSDPDPQRQQQSFEAFFAAIQSPEIFRVKVFNRQPKIVWSNLKEIIGQDAAENQEVREAFQRGKVTLKFKSQKPEQISERQFWEFTETYVPVYDPKGEVIGVVEVYQTAYSAKQKIYAELKRSLLSTTTIGVGGYLAFALVLYAGMRPRGIVKH